MSDSGKYVLGMWIFFLIATAGLLLFLGNDILDAEEAAYGVVCREMIQSGNFFVPTASSKFNLDCPGIFSLSQAASSLIGGGVGEWTLRIISLLTALATLAGLGYLGNKWFDRKIGICAMYILLGCCLFISRARSATPEMFNLAVMILSLAWFAGKVEGRKQFGAYLVFHLIAIFGLQIGGAIAWVAPYAALLPFVLRNRQKHSHFNWRNLVAFGFVVFFYVAIFGAVTLLNWERGVFGFSGEIWHREGIFGFFIDHVFRMNPISQSRGVLWGLALVPWGPLLLMMLGGMAVNWSKLPARLKDLLYASGLLLILFGATGFQDDFILLSLLGFLSLATAVGVVSGSGFFSDKTERGYRYFLMFLGSLVALNVILLPLRMRVFPLEVPLSFTLLLPFTGLLALGIFIFDEYHKGELFEKYFFLSPKFGAVILGSVLFSLSFFGVLLPPWESQRPDRYFLAELGIELDGTPGSEAAYFGDRLNYQVAYYANVSGMLGFCKDLDEVGEFLERNRGKKVTIVSKGGENLAGLSRCLAEFTDQPDDTNGLLPFPPSLKETAHKWESQRKEAFVGWMITLPE